MTWRCFPIRAVRAAHTPLAHRLRIGWHHARPRVRHWHAAWVCFAVVVPMAPLVAWLPWMVLTRGGVGSAAPGAAVPVSVPEPGTLALLAGGLVVLAGVRR